MEQRVLGRTGLRVSALGLGGGAVGGLMVRGEPADQERGLAIALDAGITFIDTAPSYGDGASETNLGRALRARGRRRSDGSCLPRSSRSRRPTPGAWPQRSPNRSSRACGASAESGSTCSSSTTRSARRSRRRADPCRRSWSRTRSRRASSGLREAGKIGWFGITGGRRAGRARRGPRLARVPYGTGAVQPADARARTRSSRTPRPRTWARSGSARWPAARSRVRRWRHPIGMAEVAPIASGDDVRGRRGRGAALRRAWSATGLRARWPRRRCGSR